MAGPKLEPEEQRALDRQREDHRLKQPYATELDNRELEHAEKDKRPPRPNDEGTAPGAPVERP